MHDTIISYHEVNKSITFPVLREMPKQQPITIATLADLGARDCLVMHCDPCNRHEEMDLWKLAEDHGPDFPLRELRRRARCNRCGKPLIIHQVYNP